MLSQGLKAIVWHYPVYGNRTYAHSTNSWQLSDAKQYAGLKPLMLSTWMFRCCNYSLTAPQCY